MSKSRPKKPIYRKMSQNDKQAALGFSKTWPAFATLIVFLALSYVVYITADSQVNSDRQLEFDKATTSVMSRFESQQNTNMIILNSMTGIYDQLVEVVLDYFTLYGSVPTDTYKYIKSLMYIKYVDQDRGEFEYDAMSMGLWDFEIHPAGNRDFYYPIYYIVPYWEGLELSGYDLATEEEILKVINKAKEENKPVATSIFTIRKPDTLGFYIMAPVYEMQENKEKEEFHIPKYYDGIVAVEVDSKQFFTEAVGSGVGSDSSIIFQVYDQVESGDEKLLWESKNAKLLKEDYMPLTSEQFLSIADRDFLIRFTTVPSFGGGFQEILPFIFAGVSVALSILMFLFVRSTITTRVRAEIIADSMTRSQRRIVDTSQDIIATLDITHVWKDMNLASESIFEYSPAEMVGQKIDVLFADQDVLKEFYSLPDKQMEEFTERMDIKMVTKNGEHKWINWSFTISNEEQNIYCIGRDVTIEKAAEAQRVLRNKQITLSERFTRESSELKSYTMSNLSHQIRNSLTGILGSLNLLKHKAYETEEEYESFVDDTIQSSEKLLNFVSSDQMEIATEQETYKELSMVNVSRSIEEIQMLLDAELPGKVFDIQISDTLEEATVLAETNLFHEALREIFKAISTNQNTIKIEMNAEENTYDNVTEITLIIAGNPVLADMIDLYKKYRNDLVNALELDKDDIILHLATAKSNVRIMRGSFTVETLGGEDENIIQIALSNKP